MKHTRIYCVTFYEEGTGTALWSSPYYLTPQEALTETQKKHPDTKSTDVHFSTLITKE